MTKSSTPTLAPIVANRATDGQFTLPSDGWVQLAPKGEYYHPESDLLQVIDDPALQAIVDRFHGESEKPNFPGLRVDYEHFSYDPDKMSTAAGWIKALQNRADGLWAQVQWSAQGEQDVKGGNYRFVSPVWLPADLQQLGNKRVRPLRLDTAGLTNNPNLRGMAPLSNRSSSGTPSDAADTPNTPKRMKSVCAALGLSADASEDAVLAEVTKLKNRATTAEQSLEPGKGRVKELETENAQLKNRNTELLTSVVDQDLAKYASRFAPEAREKWKTQLLANRAAALELLDSLPEPKVEPAAAATNGQAAETKPVHNRAATKTPGGTAAEGNTPQEKSRAKKIANRAHEIAAQQHIPFSAAWKQAEGETRAD